MTSGAITLRQIYGTRGGWTSAAVGRYRVARLVERYGIDAGLPAIASALEEGCPRKGEHDGCEFLPEAARDQIPREPDRQGERYHHDL